MGFECSCTAQIVGNDSRQDLWKRILLKDDLIVPLKGPIKYSNEKMPSDFYLGDPGKFDEETKKRLIDEMSKKFEIPESIIKKDIEEKGIPILDKDIIVSYCEPHVRNIVFDSSLDDDDFEDEDEDW